MWSTKDLVLAEVRLFSVRCLINTPFQQTSLGTCYQTAVFLPSMRILFLKFTYHCKSLFSLPHLPHIHTCVYFSLRKINTSTEEIILFSK